MIFDDIFYPGNPGRRKTVENLRAEIRIKFQNYRETWNKFADVLNDAFAKSKEKEFSSIKIDKLEKDIEKDTIGDCVNEINQVLEKTQKVLNKVVNDIGLADLLPEDWEEKGVKLDNINYNSWIAKGIFAGISISLGAFITYYVTSGVVLILTITSVVAGATLGLGTILGGVLAGAMIGGAVFVITDMIASAISGAIERKNLNEAIDALEKLKTEVADRLENGAGQINSICLDNASGSYRLDDSHVLWRMSDGSYVVIKIKTALRASADGNDIRSSEKEICEKLIAQGAYTVLLPVA